MRVGSLILLLHDVSDVPIDIAKMCNFLRFKRMTVLWFAILLLTWLHQRMYLYPSKILYSCVYDTYDIIDAPEYYNSDTMFYKVTKSCLLSFLFCLYALHSFWLNTFVKMAHKLLWKGETHDLSMFKKGERQGNVKDHTDDNWNFEEKIYPQGGGERSGGSGGKSKTS